MSIAIIGISSVLFFGPKIIRELEKNDLLPDCLQNLYDNVTDYLYKHPICGFVFDAFSDNLGIALLGLQLIAPPALISATITSIAIAILTIMAGCLVIHLLRTQVESFPVITAVIGPSSYQGE